MQHDCFAALSAFLAEQPSADEAIRVEARRQLAVAAPTAAERAAAQAQAATLDLASACLPLRQG